ncbi:MAG: amidohydrolase family protein, partial [Verrucomicrobiales bacterium]
MTRAVWILVFVFFSCPLFGQIGTTPVEGLRENTPRVHALRGATVVPAPGKSIENGTIVLRDGLIEAVGGAALAVPADARVWDVSGMTIYAGFIEPWAKVEVADAEGGLARHWNKHVRPERFAANSLDSLSSDRVKLLRGLGFTTAQLVPEAGLFGGSSCLVSLRDGSSGDRVMAKRVSQCAAFERGGGSYPGSLMGSIALMRQVLLDARWQRDSLAKYQEDPKGAERVEANESLSALRPVVDGKQRVLFRTRDELSYARFMKVAAEFELKEGFLGNGFEYRVADTIKASGSPLVVPIAFPPAPVVEDPDASLAVSLAQLEHWEFAPSNPGYLEKAGVPFSLTTAKLSDAKGKFFKNLRSSVKRGLSKDTALASLTSEPAKLVGAFGKLGTITKGKIANLIVADGDLFDNEKAKIHTVWIDGLPIEQEASRAVDLAGRWKVSITGGDAEQEWQISGSEKSLKIKFGEETFPAKVAGGRLLLAFPSAESIGHDADGVARLTAVITDPKKLDGSGVFPGGESFTWGGVWQGETPAESGDEENEDEGEKAKGGGEEAAVPELVFDRYPAGAFGVASARERPGTLLIRGATVWTCADAGIIDEGDVLIEGGKISAVGKGLVAPPGARVVEAGGRHVTPGLIDCHSHIAISGG